MNNLQNIYAEYEKKNFAKKLGVDKHIKMQNILITDNKEAGDPEIIKEIKKHPELYSFFSDDTKTEVPIAGFLNGKFVSRRIDRLKIDNKKKHIDIIDYKTDTEKNEYIDLYFNQINEYKELFRNLYPEYTISGYILWLHDFNLQKI